MSQDPCSKLYKLSNVVTNNDYSIFVTGSVDINDSGLFNYSISFENSSSTISSNLIFHLTASIKSKTEISISFNLFYI
jgi:hypothetical protein